MSGVLEKILATKRAEVATLRPGPPAGISRGPEVVARLAREDGHALRLVAEIKHRSPSAGALSTALSVADRARAYAKGGATMISVLADREYFGGGWNHVEDARRAAFEALVLAKEFVIDPVQIDAAAAAGADAVLLIVRCCADAAQLGELVKHARARKLEPLVEIVDETELESALKADARVIGVNARDLDKLSMDAKRTARVLGAIPAECIKLHLSGIKTADDVAALARTTVDGALIGEALMRLDDPSPLLRAMSAATVH